MPPTTVNPVPPTGADSDAAPAAVSPPVTLKSLRAAAAKGTKFAALTCYDATTARWLAAAGVPVLLVGDTAAEVILGEESTIYAPLDFMILLTAAVKRGAPGCFVMGDMPFMSYHASDAEAIRNAGRFMTEGRADAVKLEVDRHGIRLVERLSRAGVPVVAHLGLLPQQVKRAGGYRAVGRVERESRELIAAAAGMEHAGAIMLLLEAMPAEVSAAIVEKVSLPVIGCGAGPSCHGQIVVLQDILGLTERQPPFAQPLTHLGEPLTQAARQWIERVSRSELGPHPYQMRPVPGAQGASGNNG
ncbi:MAG: 3-methyl-2-oxobutanoate hydroxymethyltransferase [Phycisphaerales bacterium]